MVCATGALEFLKDANCTCQISSVWANNQGGKMANVKCNVASDLVNLKPATNEE